MSSAPEEDYLSIHINGVTNFAKSWAAKLGCDFEQRGDSAVIGIDEKANNLDVDPAIRRLLPPTFIDGPLGGLNKDIFQFEVAVLSAVGVEVAPFASILKSIWYRMSGSCQESRLRKVYFFWTCPQGNFTACGWFRSLLAAIEAQDINHQIEIYTVSHRIENGGGNWLILHSIFSQDLHSQAHTSIRLRPEMATHARRSSMT